MGSSKTTTLLVATTKLLIYFITKAKKSGKTKCFIRKSKTK